MKKVLLLFGVLGMISCSPDPDPDSTTEPAVSKALAEAKAEVLAEAEVKALAKALAEAKADIAYGYYTIRNDSKIVVKAGTTTIPAGECKNLKGSSFPLTITKADGSDYTSSLEKKQYKAGNYFLNQRVVSPPGSSTGPGGPRNDIRISYSVVKILLYSRDCS